MVVDNRRICGKQYQTELSVIVVARIDGFILRAIFLESGDFLVSGWIENDKINLMERRTVVAPTWACGLKL